MRCGSFTTLEHYKSVISEAELAVIIIVYNVVNNVVFRLIVKLKLFDIRCFVACGFICFLCLGDQIRLSLIIPLILDSKL